MQTTNHMHKVTLLILLLVLSVLLMGCLEDSEDERILDLLHGDRTWEDVTYVYALSQGDNPLAMVEYDKGSVKEPLLRLELDQDLNIYQKLVLEVAGVHHIVLRIQSGPDQNIRTSDIVFRLKDAQTTFEIDLNDERHDIDLGHVRTISWVATPSFDQHRGWFSVTMMQLSIDDLQGEGYINTDRPIDVARDDGQMEAFSFNHVWHDDGYQFGIDDDNNQTVIDYSTLPGRDATLFAHVSDQRTSFDHVNLTVRGDTGTVLLLSLSTDPMLSGIPMPSYELILNGETQAMTLFLEDLPSDAKSTISDIRLTVNPDTAIAKTGSFVIMFAGFENQARADRPEETVNRYKGDGMPFDFNDLWTSENGMDATFTKQDNGVLVAYEKAFTTSAITSRIEGRFSDFDHINISIEATPNTEFLFQFNTNWAYRADHHLRTDDEGHLTVTISFGLLFFDRDLDAIDLFRITPAVGQADSEGTFLIKVAQFSSTALVTYDVTETVAFDDWMQIGDTLMLDRELTSIAWDTDDEEGTLYTRVFGDFVQNNTFYYRWFRFEATVDQQVVITFEVDLAFYEILLTPGVTSYAFAFDTPTSGIASTWKFTKGFNLYMHIDTTQPGSITIADVRLTNNGS